MKLFVFGNWKLEIGIEVDPNKPVRIRLIKKKQSREEREEADFSDEGD